MERDVAKRCGKEEDDGCGWGSWLRERGWMWLRKRSVAKKNRKMWQRVKGVAKRKRMDMAEGVVSFG
jgi:hypothetical protein